MSVHVIITFVAKPEMLGAFREILNGVDGHLRGVSGCLGLQIFGKEADACTFTLVEEWTSAEAHQAHLKKVVDSGAWDHITKHLAQDPASGYYHVI